MQVRLRVQSGSHEGKEIEVSDKRFLIGRSESCQLRPKSESVSRKHCILAIKDGRVLVQDLKSRNGTFVNDKRLPADKAKVLKDGDLLRVGKLMFSLVIEHGLQAPKKPEVKDVADAAARTKKSAGEDSRFEEVDVDSWLDEADAIDRVRKQTDPDTRQFRLDAKEGENSDDLSVDGTVMIEDAPAKKQNNDTKMSSGDDTSTGSRVIPPKSKPGKLPEGAKKALKENSRDAADDALKRFFSGRQVMKTISLAMLSNEALADAYLGRDARMDSAFTELFRRHRDLVYRVCVRWLGHHQDAEDLTQETFRRVAASIQSWDRSRPIEPWLTTIAGNRCRSFLAKQRSKPRLAGIEETDAIVADVDSPASGVQVDQTLREAMASLSASSRRAFELVHFDGMSYVQASTLMGHPAGTIKTWVHRARLQVIRRVRETGGAA